MSKNNRTRLFSQVSSLSIGGVVSLMLSLFTACAPEDSGSAWESLRTIEQDLATYQSVAYWGSPGEVKLCFMKAAGHNWTTSDDIRSAQAHDILQETIGNATGLTFVRPDSGQCTNTASERLTILLQDQYGGVGSPGGWGGECIPGKGSRYEPKPQNDYTSGVQCRIGSGLDPSDPDGLTGNSQPLSTYLGVVVHEVGHGIGLPHEHQRTNESGTAHEVELCPGHLAAWTSDPTNGNLVPEPTLIKLTPYDPCSVMNYCRAEWNCGNEPFELTALDKVGLEVLYPDSYFEPVTCDGGCFHSGSGLVSRSDGSVTLSRLRRGMHPDVISAISWSTGGTSQFSADLVATVPESSYVFVSTDDAFGREFEGGANVVVDDAEWTALAMTAL